VELLQGVPLSGGYVDQQGTRSVRLLKVARLDVFGELRRAQAMICSNDLGTSAVARSRLVEVAQG
jgi:hypothetical protein